jgi:hypothetical protein
MIKKVTVADFPAEIAPDEDDGVIPFYKNRKYHVYRTPNISIMYELAQTRCWGVMEKPQQPQTF